MGNEKFNLSDSTEEDRRPCAVWIMKGIATPQTPEVLAMNSIESFGRGVCDRMFTLTINTLCGDRYQWKYDKEDERDYVFHRIGSYFKIVHV